MSLAESECGPFVNKPTRRKSLGLEESAALSRLFVRLCSGMCGHTSPTVSSPGAGPRFGERGDIDPL